MCNRLITERRPRCERRPLEWVEERENNHQKHTPCSDGENDEGRKA